MKYRFLVFFVISLFIFHLKAQEHVILLWPDDVPNQKGDQHASVISENNSGDVCRISEVTKPSLTLYSPEKGQANGKAVIVCPGGGYNILAIDKEGYEIANWLKSLGYHAFVLEYRVPGNRKGAFQDVQRAIRTVRSLASKYSLNDKKIGVMGFSAGGHLSARALTAYNESSYEHIDGIDKFDPKPDFAAFIYPAYLDDGPNRTLSDGLAMNEGLSPCFVFATADDGFGNDALVFAQAMRDSKNNIELHFLPVGGHGYGLRSGNPAADKWPGLLALWLDNQ